MVKKLPMVEWPNNAKLALQIVLNYEEGGESCVLHGDKTSEIFLSEIIGAQPIKGRHMNMESLYEYGSRSGFWRLYKLFMERKIPFTIFGVATALEKNDDVSYAIRKSDLSASGIEVACHGWKWIDYQNVPKATEKKHMKMAIKSIEKIIGERPLGWYTGRCSPNTLDLVMEEGGFLYCSDSYSDDLPYWKIKGKKKTINNSLHSGQQ